jgi:hypothetical protein
MSLTRREAILCVEDAFARFLETDLGQEDPQMWPQAQRSIQLRLMMQNDPEQYAVLVEDLRSGHIERIERRRKI